MKIETIQINGEYVAATWWRRLAARVLMRQSQPSQPEVILWAMWAGTFGRMAFDDFGKNWFSCVVMGVLGLACTFRASWNQCSRDEARKARHD